MLLLMPILILILRPIQYYTILYYTISYHTNANASASTKPESNTNTKY